MTDSLLHIEKLSVTFTGQGEVCAVRDVNLSLEKGECLALVGESGSGKSVTAQAVMGLLPVSDSVRIAGRAVLSGTDMVSAPPDVLRAKRGSRVGMIFQEPQSALNPLHTVEKQIAESLLVHGRFGRAQARQRTLELLEMVRIPDPESRLKSYPHQLSGGQRQRVMIAMALANNPDLLIADEPTTSLDVTVQARILDLLTSLRRELGMGVLFITHDLKTVRKHADRVAVMRDGQVVEQGATERIFTAGQHEYTRTLLDTALPDDAPDAEGGQMLLQVDDLTVDFPLPGRLKLRSQKLWEKPKFRAVDNVSVEIRTGRNLAVVGESGSGKSTFACAVLGLTRSSGAVKFLGMDVAGMDKVEILSLRRRMQPVFQDPFASLNPRMTTGDIVMEGLNAHDLGSRGEREDMARTALTDVGLDASMLDRYPHEFSGGQRQRVAIARALVMRPRLMILDEPTSALDKPVQMQMVQLLSELGRTHGVTYVFITHDLSLVRALCHDVMVMHEGRAVEQGTVRDVFHSPQQEYTARLLAAAR